MTATNNYRFENMLKEQEKMSHIYLDLLTITCFFVDTAILCEQRGSKTCV